MTTIMLPLTRAMQWCGPALVLVTAGLVLLCPIVWPWRLLTAAAVLMLGASQWLRYLGRRPVSLSTGADGGMSCMLADGRTFEVSRILPGVIRPYLVSARLEGRAGERCDLLVPGAAVQATVHWQLRRALLGFRPDAGPDRMDRRRGPSVQSDEWRGM